MRLAGWTPIPDEHHAIRAIDRNAWFVLMELYARVRRKGAAAKTSRGIVHLEAGQCVFGYAEIAASVGMSVSAVRCATRRLEDEHGVIAIEGTSLGSIATIPFVQDFQNPKTSRTRDDKRAANERHLTDTEKTDTADGHSSSISSSPDDDDHDPQIVELHELQESLRRQRLGEHYRPIPIHQVATRIAERLADFSSEDCACVVRADAEEVTRGGNAAHFGLNTWSTKNFGIKLPRQRQVEADREGRKTPRVPLRHRRYVQQRKLQGHVRTYKLTEREALVAHYGEFPRWFHKEKGTWPDVRRHWDRDAKQWKD
jgi:hypothetical protein